MESERSPLAIDQHHDSGNASAGAAATPADDELQGVIADVERQLASLRTYRAQHEEARVRWQAMEQELARRAAEVSAQSTEVAAEKDRLAQAHAKLKELDAELAGRAERIEKDFHSLSDEQKRAAEVAEKREADLAGRCTTLEQREARLAEQAASISKQREQVQSSENELAQREKALGEQKAGIDRRMQEIAALESRVSEAEVSVRRLGAELAAAQEEASKTAGLLAERAQEIEGHKQEIARSTEAQSELFRTLTDRENSRTELKAGLRDAMAKLEQSMAAAAEGERKAADFKRQLIDRDGRIQELSGKLAAATGKLREVSQGIQEQAELVGQARDLEARLAERTAQVAAMESELAEARARLEDAGAEAPDASILAERETLRLRAEELEEQLLASHARLEQSAAEIAELRERVETGEGPSSAGVDGVPDEVGEAIVTRWRRLRLMRSILREQAEKLRQAGEAVRSRFEEVESVAAERQKLARERASFAASKAHMEVKTVRPGVSSLAVSCYAAIAIVALAGLSWAVGGQLAPATYEAKATIAADQTKGTSPADLLAEWQKYHESLLKDPALTETAAERMARRGIITLGTPGALMSKIDSDLNTQSPGAGQLTLHLRGKGAVETERVLDTYVTALVSQANADRERRTDGLGTVISEAPSVGSGPVEDPRLVYAAGVFAVGTLLSFGFGALALRGISASRDRVEHGPDDDTPADWEKPPQDYVKA